MDPAALSIARVVGPFYLLLGVSVLLYIKSWRHLYAKWEEDHFSLFTLMLMAGAMGLMLINIYNVWAWNLGLIVTLTGWGLLIKSAAFFLLPGSAVKKLLHMKNQPWVFYLGGLVGLVVGGALTYYSYY